MSGFQGLQDRDSMTRRRAFLLAGGTATAVPSLFGQPGLINRNRNSYVNPNVLPGNLGAVAQALGSRHWKPGKERLALRGTLQRGTEAPVALAILTEHPNLARIDHSRNGRAVRTAHDEVGPWKNGGPLDDDDDDLLESVFYDGVDRLLFGQAEGRQVETVVVNARLRGGSPSEMFDVYLMTDEVSGSKGKRAQPKHYVFHSRTQRLDHVRYRATIGANTLDLRTEFRDWTVVNGEAIAATVRRTANGREIFRIQTPEVTVSARAADSAFGRQA